MTIARQSHEGVVVTVAERLAECEAVVERSFVECGLALRTIRDERLYRETHSSFEAYCAERWDMNRVYAHRLIEAAQITEALPIGNKPATESQARELVGLEPAQAAEVMRETVERTDGKPTAKTIRETRAEVIDGRPTTKAVLQEIHRPPRRHLPKAFWETRYDLGKKVESLHRLANDDRFPTNRKKVAEANLNDLIQTRDLLNQVISKLA